MALNLDKNNADIKDWTRDAIKDFKTTASGMGVEHRADSPSPSPSIDKFRDRYKQDGGAIAKIGIQFPRTLIYTHNGSGKGRGGTKGSRWVDKYGTSKKTNPKSFGKMGTGGRLAKPFINQVLDGENGVEKLGTIVATNLGDAIVGSLFVK
jgi:hypothetical protein